jgi:hypothetical protein
MEIELPIRWIKPKTKAREDLERHHNTFKEKYGIEPKEELEPEDYDDVFMYAPMTFAMEDIARFNQADRDHTVLTFKDSARYIAKVPYSTFQGIFESLTLRKIMVIKSDRLHDLES